MMKNEAESTLHQGVFLFHQVVLRKGSLLAMEGKNVNA